MFVKSYKFSMPKYAKAAESRARNKAKELNAQKLKGLEYITETREAEVAVCVLIDNG